MINALTVTCLHVAHTYRYITLRPTHIHTCPPTTHPPTHRVLAIQLVEAESIAQYVEPGDGCGPGDVLPLTHQVAREVQRYRHLQLSSTVCGVCVCVGGGGVDLEYMYVIYL